MVEHQVSLSEDEFKLAVEKYYTMCGKRNEIEIDSLFDRLIKLLIKEGWQSAGFIDGRIRLIHTRRRAAPSRWFPSRTVSPIYLNFPYYLHVYENGMYHEDDINIYLDYRENAKLDLRVPKYTIASTYPPLSQRADLLDGEMENITVPVNDESEVRVAILSPLLRWRFGPTVSELSAWSGLKWLILALCFVLSEEIKKTVLAPPVKRLLKLFGVKGALEKGS